MTQHHHKRHIANFLLQPLIQLRIGLAGIGLMIAGFAVLSAYVYAKMADFTEVIVTLTESDQSIRNLIAHYINSTGLVALCIVVATMVVNMIVTIYFTHKMVGPTVAFRRHIGQLQKGVYGQRVKLRKGDAFIEVADELNKLAEILEQEDGKKSEKSA